MNNILLLTDKLITGGAEMYFCKLENYLKHEDMTFYSAAATGELYHQIHNKHHFIPLSLKNHPANLYTLSKQVMKLDIDVIHANSFRMLLYSIVIKKMTGRKIKLIYTKHNVTILEKKFPALFKKVLNQHVNQIIAVSNFEKERLLQFGIRKSLIRTIYNGVDVKHFSFQQIQPKEALNIGILARLSKEKNHELFLKIANELKDVCNVMFYIAGDGPERDFIEKMIHDFKLNHKVKLLGNTSNPYEFICSMDLLLLTSLREVFPMVVIEAMASGTPIISVDVGGIKEAIIDDETGILVSHHSEKEFAKKIQLLHNNQNLRKCLGKAAREKVEKSFSLSNMIHSTLETYQY
ncbi:glycosyltransferase [Bacillus pseudomycoides]|uniref:Glycosyltransferase n=1 Tax=Bacillus pseudomycoides TaxID=64104 RepID=A0A2C3XX54_9BACI|nr:glycosyltransferase family 4 protein [Bacillus pseudomycoides]PDY45269.1 glycosyltransferase [Bacillus pseudomycoides]PEA81711.1 glycosyltransferase [Bacillus pseudomycoides]PEM66261.1 glycosyltransferase [Bacillus pseudomycoides]PHB48556.1 glycosyltransferase [Bacillus pseudomycoides]